MRFHPAFAPLAYLPIAGAYLRCNLLVAALRMLEGVQNDLRPRHLSLRGVVRADNVMELLNFCCHEFDGIDGSGTSHVFHLLDPLSPVSACLAVKLGISTT